MALGEKEKAMAIGGIVTGPTRALIGEAGPEAVIPLNQLMNEFKEMKQILNAILHKEGTIMLNGTKMGTALHPGSAMGADPAGGGGVCHGLKSPAAAMTPPVLASPAAARKTSAIIARTAAGCRIRSRSWRRA